MIASITEEILAAKRICEQQIHDAIDQFRRDTGGLLIRAVVVEYADTRTVASGRELLLASVSAEVVFP